VKALRWLVVALLAVPGLARAQALVRVADYPSFGRVTFEFAAPTAFKVVRRGDRLVLAFEGAPAVGAAARLPRNVRSIQGGAGGATLVMAPGAQFHVFRDHGRVSVDVLDPAPNRSAGSVPGSGQTPVAAATPTPASAPSPKAEHDQPITGAEGKWGKTPGEHDPQSD